MSDIAISVKGLGKRYRIGREQEIYRTVREKLNSAVTAPFQALRSFSGHNGHDSNGNGDSQSAIRESKSEFIWALKDVSFEIKRGEVVGIIGRNGAGKSTLLKILSRITEPTEGYADINGRVGSLLEVGTGFHPELTGRENIYLNGSILGMQRAEIRRNFDEIVAFAEIEKFIDTPVKFYSSGMYVRLAFAVAAQLEPEILLVDEVLAVGDAGFQKKCLGKMGDVAKEGRTVLFVSHNMGAITTLCPEVLWLDAGLTKQIGNTREIVNKYLSVAPQESSTIDVSRLERKTLDTRLRIQSLTWLSEFPPQHGEGVRARIEFRIESAIDDVSIGIGFSSLEGVRLLTYETDYQKGFRPSLKRPGIYSVELEIRSLPLAPAMYILNLGCRSGDRHELDYVPFVAQIEIIPGTHTPGYIMRQDGGVRLPSLWSWEEEIENWQRDTSLIANRDESKRNSNFDASIG